MLSPITPIPISDQPAGRLAGEAPPVLLVGGSFDPPHKGHVELPAAARDAALPAGTLVFVPASRSPHKQVGPIASDADRCAMLEAASRDVANTAVWTDEIDRAAGGSASYWVDTLERARSVLGEAADLRFVLGADQALALHRWREPRRILSLARPVVLLRPPVAGEAQLTEGLAALGFWEPDELRRLVSAVVDVGTIDVSSTRIRECLRGRGASGTLDPAAHKKLGEMISPSVLDVIVARGLYRDP